MLSVREALEETKAGVRFKAAKTKSGRRDISLPDVVVDVLREHRRKQMELRMALGLGKLPDGALVFPALDGGPTRPSNMSGDWATLAETIGFPGITFHALRHTHASMLIDCRPGRGEDQQAHRPRRSLNHLARLCPSVPDARRQVGRCYQRGSSGARRSLIGFKLGSSRVSFLPAQTHNPHKHYNGRMAERF